MKQIFQSLKDGKVRVENLPSPRCLPGNVVIRTSKTLISSGTEKSLIDFGKSNFIQKIRTQPNKVREVIDKISVDGIFSTIETVMNKLNQPVPLGYCNVGEIVEVGKKVKGLSVGDRVISNGFHASYVSVPENLCCRIPDNVDDVSAAFTVIGSIALQGVRLTNPTIGETVVVNGLGLVGLMTVQILRANGCKVIGLDLNEDRLKIAKSLGAETINISKENPVDYISNSTQEVGIDAVIITASTISNEPVHQSAKMCRKRGRITLVGVVGLDLKREDFYEKEITFQVSSSYGPGRYEKNYEERGLDYPIGFVRWTEKRNFEALITLISEEKIVVSPLVSEVFGVEETDKAYDKVSDGGSLGVLIDFSEEENHVDYSKDREIELNVDSKRENKLNVSFIGSGQFSTKVLIPAFNKAGVNLRSLCSNTSTGALNLSDKFKFQKLTTDPQTIFKDKSTDLVTITTRHDSHAEYIIKALEEDKIIFVEKPLCLSLEDLNHIQERYKKVENPRLMIGFNRRFSPFTKKIKELVSISNSPCFMVMNVNAGHISKYHWTQDREQGGGRIIGEVCHFIDLLFYINGYGISSWSKDIMKSSTHDSLSITLSFSDGSLGVINYFSNGPKSYPKETLEIFKDGKSLQLNNFRYLKGKGWKDFKYMSSYRQNKGHANCVKEYIRSIEENSTNPIPFQEIYDITKLSIEISDSN